MEKPKNSPIFMDALGDFFDSLTALIVWLGNNKFITFWAMIVGAMISGLVILIIGLVIFVYQDVTTTPAERFARYTEFYNQCVETGIYYEACETAALDYAGLDRDE